MKPPSSECVIDKHLKVLNNKLNYLIERPLTKIPIGVKFKVETVWDSRRVFETDKVKTTRLVLHPGEYKFCDDYDGEIFFVSVQIPNVETILKSDNIHFIYHGKYQRLTKAKFA